MKLKNIDEDNVLVCVDCGYRFYRNSKPTVGAIITNDKNQVLMIRRKTEKLNGLWSVPGGYLENGEDPATGFKRETKEEIGVVIDVGDIVSFEIENDPWALFVNSYVLDIQFKSNIVSGKPKPLHEVSEIAWFSKDEIPWKKIAFAGVKKALKIIDNP